jgi:glycosyltransferase involved in cell wall biosynthesis
MSDVALIIAAIMRPEGETGVQTHFRAFADYLRSIGVEPEVVTPYSSPTWMVLPIFALRRLLKGGASVWWYRYWHSFFLKRALRQRLRTLGSAVIYAQSPEAASAAMEARSGAYQKVAMAVHFWRSQADGWILSGAIRAGDHLDQEIRGFERRVIPRLDAIVYVSDFGKREIEAAIPNAADVPCATIPNFVDIPGKPTRRATRDAITIGTLERRKNQRHLIEVIVEARALGRDVTLTIVGDGPDRIELERLARDGGVDDLIDFAGFVKNAANLLPSHRVYVHAALVEVLGIALIEALGHGRPILAPATGGTDEVFTDGLEGYLWPLEDAAECAKILVGLLDDDKQREEMSRAARSKFERSFATAVMAPKLAEFLMGSAATHAG